MTAQSAATSPTMASPLCLRRPTLRVLCVRARLARSILAERFARGEIDGDEFMERASVLNWTPGVEPLPQPHKKHRRR